MMRINILRMKNLPELVDFKLAHFQAPEKNNDQVATYLNPFFIMPTEASDELIRLNLSEPERVLTNKETHGYFEVYSRLFELFRGKDSVNLIELGIGSIEPGGSSSMFDYHQNLPKKIQRNYFPGGSLMLWKKFLGDGANVAGWDIDISKAQCPSAMLYETDSTNKEKIRLTLSKTLNDFSVAGRQGIDIFIDDGLHREESQINTFESVYPYLNIGGIYIIEDLGSPQYILHKSTKNVTHFNITTLRILEKVIDISGKQAHIYQTLGGSPGCMICVQK